MDNTDSPTLVCTEAGVFAWPGYALVERHGTRFVRASEREICHHIGSLCGGAVIYGPLVPMLERAARFLESGHIAKAQACIGQLRLPPRAREVETLYLRSAALSPPPFAKLFNPDLHPRWPAGQSDGGQFRPADGGGERYSSGAAHGTSVAVRDRGSECNDRCYHLLERPLPYKFSNLNEFAFRRCFYECMQEPS